MLNLSTLFASALTLSVAGAGVAASEMEAPRSEQSRHTKAGHKKQGRGLCAQLECSTEQREKIRSSQKQMRTQIKPHRAAMKQIRHDLGGELRKSSLDRKRVESLFGQLHDHQREVSEAIQDNLVEVHATLTPTQREKLAQRVERRGPRKALKGKGHKGKGHKGKGHKGKGHKGKGHKGKDKGTPKSAR